MHTHSNNINVIRIRIEYIETFNNRNQTYAHLLNSLSLASKCSKFLEMLNRMQESVYQKRCAEAKRKGKRGRKRKTNEKKGTTEQANERKKKTLKYAQAGIK